MPSINDVADLAREGRRGAPAASLNMQGVVLGTMGSLGGIASHFSTTSSQPRTDVERAELAALVGCVFRDIVVLAEACGIDPVTAAMDQVRREVRRVHPPPLSRIYIDPATDSPPLGDRSPGSLGSTFASNNGSSGTASGTAPPSTSDSPSRAKPASIEVHGGSRSVSPCPISPRSQAQFLPMLEELLKHPLSQEEFDDLGLCYCVPSDSSNMFKELIPNGRRVRVALEHLPEYVAMVREYMSGGAAGEHGKHAKRVIDLNPSYHPEELDGKFSPTHFQAGLFSPHTKDTHFEIECDEEESTQMVPAALRREAAANSFQAAADAIGSPSTHSPTAQDSFQTPRRTAVKLTLEPEALASSDRKPVSMPRGFDPQKEATRFSPTHYEHDMFAPAATVVQDFGSRDYHPPTDGQHQPPQQMLPVPAPANSTTFGDTVGRCTKDKYRRFIRSLHVQPSSVDGFDVPVTFCGPHPDFNGSVVDLVPNGRMIPVTSHNVQEFISLTAKYLEIQLLPSSPKPQMQLPQHHRSQSGGA